jgi:LPXTG-site transpeptidase (sortase) family protein
MKNSIKISLILIVLLLVFYKPGNSNIYGAQNIAANGPTRIIIPEISIDLGIKKAKIINGYWEVFDDSAAWGEGSGELGKPGNMVIFAHDTKGLFYTLKDIKIGDIIYIYGQETYSYKVTEIKNTIPSDLSVIAPTKDQTLTLYTCSGPLDSKRLVVVAKRL